MTSPLFNDPTLKSLSFALDGLSTRQRATANNIANVDTPGYKSQNVNFESRLQAAMGDIDSSLGLSTTNAKHLGARNINLDPDGITVRQQTNSMRNDENNVDIDLEMTTLAETTLRYQALSQVTGMKISLLKTLIRG